MRRPPVLNIHKMLAQGLPSHTNGRGRWLGATWIPLPGIGIPLPGRLIPREKTGQMTDCHLACEVSGSPGRVRTCDTLINSQLRYHCATGEFSTREVIIRITPRDATLKLNFFLSSPGPCLDLVRRPPLTPVPRWPPSAVACIMEPAGPTASDRRERAAQQGSGRSGHVPMETAMPIAPAWNCSNIALDLSRPRVMGVLNVTPDSFSDGGTHNTPKAAIATASQMLADGADLIDMGGESTRPGFTPVQPDEEFQRLEPVVRWLVREGTLVSIDTRHPEVAQRCIDLGAQIINDVTGFSDPRMVKVAATSDCGCVVMHSGPVSGTATKSSAVMASAEKDDLSALMNGASAGNRAWEASGDKPLLPDSSHVMSLLEGYLLDRARDLEARGVSASRICLDPGVGFGKSPEDSIVILRATKDLASLGYPLMCAVSRKRFVGTVSGVASAPARDDATIGISLAAAARGARVLRVHNVPGMTQALDGFWAASEPWTSRVTLLLSPAAEKDVQQAIEAVDAMPLTRVRGSNASLPGGQLQLEVETALDRIPFQHELDSALGAAATKVELSRTTALK